MKKKKELPKAMSGGVKPLIRAVVSTGKVTGKATVRGVKAFGKSAKHTSLKDALKGADIKAGVKGFVRGVKSETKKLKKPKISIAEPDLGPDLGSAKKSTSDWIKAGTKPKTSTNNVVETKPKKKLTTKQKVSIGVATGAAVAGSVKYANRKRRTLND